jgi:transposase
MAKVYSDDLRRKLLEAHQRGEGSLPSLAARFSVSVGWAKKVSRALLHSGEMERPPGAKRGPASKLTAEVREQLRSWIATQADLTLAELRVRLERELGLSVSVGRLWTVLREINLRLKKSHSTPPSRTPRQADGNARSGGSRWSGSRRRG